MHGYDSDPASALRLVFALQRFSLQGWYLADAASCLARKFAKFALAWKFAKFALAVHTGSVHCWHCQCAKAASLAVASVPLAHCNTKNNSVFWKLYPYCGLVIIGLPWQLGYRDASHTPFKDGHGRNCSAARVSGAYSQWESPPQVCLSSPFQVASRISLQRLTQISGKMVFPVSQIPAKIPLTGELGRNLSSRAWEANLNLSEKGVPGVLHLYYSWRFKMIFSTSNTTNFLVCKIGSIINQNLRKNILLLEATN